MGGEHISDPQTHLTVPNIHQIQRKASGGLYVENVWRQMDTPVTATFTANLR